ncbi:MAG: tRNA threonylcarbamoyladenosine biosynthesis protein [Gracilibacter sp. BRH_c7a]|nr:MAG: tRNA threonylcarbamoyladenosine biosynthesis protein [Gracilibacter sp. BRH_c7a]
MKTKRVIINQENQAEALREAAELLHQGEVVAFPTETVYGLGANALDSAACEKIFQIKGRPADNPLIVHVASVEDAKKIVRYWPAEADLCAAKFWPGPLTIVLPKDESIPGIISAGLDTVAIRMPSHPVALALIQAVKVPLAAPSANISGKPSPTDGEHVWQDLNGKLPLILDSGRTDYGLESTVLDLSGTNPTILRPGGITREQLIAELGKVELDAGVNGQLQASAKPKAPGMKYRHYAPRGKVILLDKESDSEIAEAVRFQLKNKKNQEKLALLCLRETASILESEIPVKVDLLYILGSRNNLQEAASRLFEGLRLCDEQGIDIIMAEGMTTEGIGLAYMNRLQKAVGKNSYLGFEKI